MQQLNWYWQALWALTSGWGALSPSLSLSFSVPLFCCFSKEIANLRCRQGRALLEVSVRTPGSPGFYSVSAPFPLIPARESLSNGLISCTNATFIMARSILCFQYVGSAVIPWPFWNMFALNGCLEEGKTWEDVLWGLRENMTNFITETLHVYKLYTTSLNWL